MIDIHSHVLPKVDDGSPSLEASLKMLENCINQGVSDLVITPHFRRETRLSPKTLRTEFNKFNAVKNEKNLPVNLYLGQEVFYTKETRQLLRNGEILPINGSRYILLEFDYTDPCDIAEISYDFTLMDYIPVIAHVERYSYVDLNAISDVKFVGGLIQVNADTVIGDCSKRETQLLKKLFKFGLVDLVASDYHSVRENNLKKAYDTVKEKYGENTAELLFKKNAERILGIK